jgi:L-asparaginase
VTEPTTEARVTVFSLGGTIASTDDGPAAAGRGVTPRLGARGLLQAVPRIQEVAELEAVAFRQTASGDLTLQDLVALAAEITQRFEQGVDGVVVTQGTDTIEETSFALDLLVPGDRPVVVTGAMRNPTLAGPDGPANLLAAVQVAAAPAAAGLGTVVVVNDEVHAARFVRKTHTSSPATFRSVTVGPLGWIVEGRPRIAFRMPTLAGVPYRLGEGAVPPVALLTSVLGTTHGSSPRWRQRGTRGWSWRPSGVATCLHTSSRRWRSWPPACRSSSPRGPVVGTCSDRPTASRGPSGTCSPAASSPPGSSTAGRPGSC